MSSDKEANAERPTPNAQRRMRSAPVALTIAGSDSSAGAGIQADLKTFSALGVYGVCAVTCVVAETPGHVRSIHAVPRDAVRDQIAVLLANFPIGAAKTGLLHSAEIVSEIASAAREYAARTGRKLPLVVDPVMVATSGDLLLESEAVARYEAELFPVASLVTPNLDEAAALLGERVETIDQMRKAGAKLTQKYGVPFLLKGGHLTAGAAIDLLFCDGAIAEFAAPFTRGVRTHGTGCTYSAAIAAGLAARLSLEQAVGNAKQYVSRTIADHLTFTSGRGEIHALNHRAGELPAY